MSISKQKRQLFPEKLWDLVNKPSSGIKWSPDGKRIEVERAQLEKFLQAKLYDRNYGSASSSQLQQHSQLQATTKFRSHNYDSFIRQLHFYGFKKSGNSYHHDKFQRGQPDALHTMKRKYSNISLPASSCNSFCRRSSTSSSSSSSVKFKTSSIPTSHNPISPSKKMMPTMASPSSLSPYSSSSTTVTCSPKKLAPTLHREESGRGEVTMYLVEQQASSYPIIGTISIRIQIDK